MQNGAIDTLTHYYSKKYVLFLSEVKIIKIIIINERFLKLLILIELSTLKKNVLAFNVNDWMHPARHRARFYNSKYFSELNIALSIYIVSLVARDAILSNR